ncbi:MAG: hypothetical protein H6581_07865 [Bacteroidia bacterium]|nr:hypothetical protein [Bacteroidia bacterium]
MSCPPQVESLAITFLTHRQYRSAAWFFARCLVVQPSNANVWYGLANAMTTLGFAHSVNEWTETGIACHKRAIQEAGGHHHLSDEFLESLALGSPEGKKMVDEIGVWDKKMDLLPEAIPFTEEVLISEYREIDIENDRLAILMFGGETRFIEVLPLYKFVLLSQDELNPKLVVLDTIHLFRNEPGVEEIFMELKEQGDLSHLNPYLGLALDRIGAKWTRDYPRFDD